MIPYLSKVVYPYKQRVSLLSKMGLVIILRDKVRGRLTQKRIGKSDGKFVKPF
jgi:hypothetical protein